jgi:hypothetical protein
MKKTPIYCIEGYFKEEDEDIAFFECPITGINTFNEEEWQPEVYPKELIYFAMGVAFSETEYVSSEFEEYLEDYNEGKMEDELKFEKYDWFYEYLITKLPKDKNFYVLQVDHPEGMIGDWNLYVYEGVYKEA